MLPSIMPRGELGLRFWNLTAGHAAETDFVQQRQVRLTT